VTATGAALEFRPLTRDDLGQLSAWLAAPHVHRWWREPADVASVTARYGPAVDGEDPTELFVVELGGRSVGFVQRYRLDDDPAWAETLAVAQLPAPAAGIDYLLGPPELTGRGLGPEMIARFLTATWRRHPDIVAVVADVDQDNRRSWRALEKAGFVRHWAGVLDSAEPSDAGPCYLYLCPRPGAGGGRGS